MNICIFGDSVVWGAWLPSRVGWANLLRNYLEKNFGSTFSVYNLGIDGNTTNDLLLRFDIETKARSPELIIFEIGVNDSCYRETRNKPLVDIDTFKRNIKILINKAKTHTHKITFLGLVKGNDKETMPLPSSSTGKCYDKENVVLYDEAIKNVCLEENVDFIDLYSLLDDQDFVDGLHPNPAGHIKIFEIVRKMFDSE